MIKLSRTFLGLIFSALSVRARYVVYYDQFHPGLPDASITAGIDHVIMAFANSSLFTTNPTGEYVPFEQIQAVRSRFDPGTKILVAIGGWGDTIGFGLGAATEESRKLYASNIAATITRLGIDGVDIDWEYPGGNSEDYLRVPNSNKVSEIETFPLFLSQIRSAIGPDKILTVATPARQVDMIAYTPEKASSIWASADWVNVMTYDIMNRRDSITKHHTDLKGSLETVDYYINTLHLDPKKINLGFAMYAKWFTLDSSQPCESGIGCKTVTLEGPDGVDTGKSGTTTFEASNYALPPANMVESTNGACGATAGTFCKPGFCCSSSGFCGNTPEHCNGCQGPVYGSGCTTPGIASLFQKAMKCGTTDPVAGAQFYYDRENHLFWTWDSPEIIERKFTEVVAARGLGGVMVWSIAEDSFDYQHLRTLQKNVSKIPKR